MIIIIIFQNSIWFIKSWKAFGDGGKMVVVEVVKEQEMEKWWWW